MSSEDETPRLGRDTEPAPPNEGRPGPGLPIGSQFAGHRVEAELGRGGMGVVYRAHHAALDTERALKVVAPALASDPRFRARFARELRLAASIEHPNVIPVHHAGEESGRLYLSMRLVEGQDLAALVDEQGPLEPRRVADIVRQIAAGLDAAHRRGLVHRDVKPSNVLVEGVPGAERAYVTDFGISRERTTEAGVTTTGEFLGTADYVAPEQIQGDPVDERADVYSLGGVSHFLLTGEAPFPNRSEPAKLIAHTNAPRPAPSRLMPKLPRSVDDVIGRAMAVDPAARYTSAGGFAVALDRALERSPRRHLAPSAWRIVRTPLAIVLGIVAVGTIAVAVAGRGGDGDADPVRRAIRPAGQVVATIPVGDAPTAIAAGSFKFWVTSRDAVLTGIDPATQEIDPRATVGEGAEPVAVEIAFGSVWVLDRGNDSLVRMNPDQGISPQRIEVGRSPSDMVEGVRGLWVANTGDGTVSRIDPNLNAVALTVSLGGNPSALAFGAESLWVADARNRSVWQIDPSLGAVVGQPISVGRHPSAIAVGSGSLWVLDDHGGRLHRIDPEARTAIGRPIDVGSKPSGLAVGAGSAWVAKQREDAVLRIDASTGRRIGASIPVGDRPVEVAVGFNSVWSADSGAASVSQITPSALGRGQGP